MFQATLDGRRVLGPSGRFRLARYGALDNLEFSTRYTDGFGGHDLCSFDLDPSDWTITGLALPGDWLKIDVGSLTDAWVGRLVKVMPTGDGDVQRFHARGYAHDLAAYLALRDNSPVVPPNPRFEPTSIPHIAIDDAVNRGLPLSLDAALPTASAYAADPTSGLNNISDLLTASLREDGYRWWVYGDVLAAVIDATTPLWRFRAGGQVLGVSGTDFASVVYVRFLDADNGDALSIAQYPEPGSFLAPFGDREFGEDITDLGPMTAGRATGLAKAMYDQVKRKAVITDSLDFEGENGGGLEAAAGGAAILPFVRSGQIIRVTDFRASLTQAIPEAFVNMMIGQTTYRLSRANGESLTVTPMNQSPQSFEELLALYNRGDKRPARSEVSG